MTFHEHLAKEVLDSFDKGILTRERLELLCNDLLKGDSLFTELYAEHISSKSEQETVIKFLKKELIHKTSYRQVMKRQYNELKQKYESVISLLPKERYIEPHLLAEFTVSGWTEKEKAELLNKWKEINKRHLI